MRPFSLEEYLKDPSRKVVTRDGRNVRIVCTDRKGEGYPIVALVDSKWGESTTIHTKDGKYVLNNASDCDLFFAPEKHEGWMHIYKHIDGHCEGDGVIYNTKEQCEVNQSSRTPYRFQHIAIAKIEWEE